MYESLIASFILHQVFRIQKTAQLCLWWESHYDDFTAIAKASKMGATSTTENQKAESQQTCKNVQ